MIVTSGLGSPNLIIWGFGSNVQDVIKMGMGVIMGHGWKLGSFPSSNPREYYPYTRLIPDAASLTFAAELYFGGGVFGGGQFGVGEKLWAPTFAPETPSTPIYV